MCVPGKNFAKGRAPVYIFECVINTFGQALKKHTERENQLELNSVLFDLTTSEGHVPCVFSPPRDTFFYYFLFAPTLRTLE